MEECFNKMKNTDYFKISTRFLVHYFPPHFILNNVIKFAFQMQLMER